MQLANKVLGTDDRDCRAVGVSDRGGRIGLLRASDRVADSLALVGARLGGRGARNGTKLVYCPHMGGTGVGLHQHEGWVSVHGLGVHISGLVHCLHVADEAGGSMSERWTLSAHGRWERDWMCVGTRT